MHRTLALVIAVALLAISLGLREAWAQNNQVPQGTAQPEQVGPDLSTDVGRALTDQLRAVRDAAQRRKILEEQERLRGSNSPTPDDAATPPAD